MKRCPLCNVKLGVVNEVHICFVPAEVKKAYRSGMKEGRKEVVKWLEQEHMTMELNPIGMEDVIEEEGYVIFGWFRKKDWQAKKKEWGIE